MILAHVASGPGGAVVSTGAKLIPMTATEPAGYGVLESRIGYTFQDRALCEMALTHKSWLNERHGTARSDNERLEFLGDAVLALAVSDMLMRRFPERSEGELSKTRAALVSEAGLARTAEAIGLGEWIFLGRGEDQAGGRRKPSILSDALEAVVGAVYLDGGYASAHQLTERLFGDALRDVDSSARFDFKSRLQERSQAMLQATPQYSVVGQEGPDHDRRFLVAIRLDGREYGRATGRSKKEAEQSAAAKALDVIDGHAPPPPPPLPPPSSGDE
jgi:ribonuclease-3